VKELLNHNIEMKANQKGYHPIHYAAVSKRGAFCLELLINMNIDVSLRSSDGKTPLHIAALHQNFSCAQILIYKGPVCFHSLALFNETKFFNIILKNNQKTDDSILNAQDNDKQTPLHLAAMVGNELMVSILLECGASIFM
jgi:ankyrin repeat protein